MRCLGTGRLSRFSAVAVVLVLVAASFGCSDSDSDRSGNDAVTDPGTLLGESPFATIAEGLVEGIAGSASDGLFTFALSGIAGTGGDSAALNKISGQLSAINSDLKTMEGQLSALINAVYTQTCDEGWDTISGFVSTLENWWNEYSGFVNNYSQGTASLGPKPSASSTWPPSDFATFADKLYGENGLDSGSAAPVMTRIQNLLLGAGGAQGVIGSCIVANTSSSNIPQSGTWDDRKYWCEGPVKNGMCQKGIQNIMNYWYGLQLQMLTMMADAYHYQAWLSCGSTCASSSYDLDNLCNETTAETSLPAPNVICEQLQDWMDTGDIPYYAGIYNQWVSVGAPYTNDTTRMLQVGQTCLPGDAGCTSTVSYLWPRSLENVTWPSNSGKAACGTLDSNTNVCGPAALPFSDSAPTFEADYAPDYTNVTWDVATPADMHDLIKGWNSGKLGDYMNANGFADVGDYIVIFAGASYINVVVPSDTWSDLGPYSGDIACFIHTALDYSDTGEQPFCADMGDVQKLSQPGVESGCDLWPKAGTVVTADFLSTTDYNYFYNAYLRYCDNETPWTTVDWQTAPRWSSGDVKQFYWPKANVTDTETSNIDCSVGGATNVGGVLSMCGADLKSHIGQQMPSEMIPSE